VGVLGLLVVAFGLGIGVSGEFVRVSLGVSFFFLFAGYESSLPT
jgi:hypothetical protein